MDNLTHALVGLAMGHAGLKRRTPLALTTLAVAANVPDIDVAVFATSTLPMYFRRGWTHGPIAMVVLPLVVAAAVVWWDRRVRQRRASPPPPVVPREILLLAVLGTWSHPLMDYMNSYGIRLLMPFSGRWFYGDALYKRGEYKRAKDVYLSLRKTLTGEERATATRKAAAANKAMKLPEMDGMVD